MRLAVVGHSPAPIHSPTVDKRSVPRATGRHGLRPQDTRKRRWAPRLMPKLGRILKLARPYADFRYHGAVFIVDIVERVFSEGDRLPLLDHPAADVDAFDRAQRHHATIAVCITANAVDGLAADPLPERL